MFPARIHVILAREARTAIVFRRGPAKQVCTLAWDRRTDRFELGQWMFGRIDALRADLSPDGRHLIYFAISPNTALRTWTAISRAPWLTALALFEKGDTHNGGGLFLGNRRYWLDDGEPRAGWHKLRYDRSGLDRDLDYVPVGGPSTGDTAVYYPRLLRDGWQVGTVDDPERFRVFEKPVAHGWVLRKIFDRDDRKTGQEGRGTYAERHGLENPGTGQLEFFPDWEWADVDGRDIVYAEKGCLFRQEVRRKWPWPEPRCLIDLNPMEFENREAPYSSGGDRVR